MSIRKRAVRAAAILAVAGGVAATLAAPAHADPRTWHYYSSYSSRAGCLVSGLQLEKSKHWYQYECLYQPGEGGFYQLWYQPT